MPDVASHLNQARHNEGFYTATDKNVYSDWAMTAIYYAALHYIDAFLASVGVLDPGAHKGRDEEFGRKAVLRPVYPEYFRLKNRSENARYYCRRYPMAELERSYRNDLIALREHILRLLPP